MKKNIKYKIKKLKAHDDKRGWLVELLKTNEIEKPVKQLHIASIKPSHVRGNHYHANRIEWLFLVIGSVEFMLEDVKTKKKTSFKIVEENHKVITIFPNTSHAVKNIGKKTAYIVSAQSDIYNRKNPDTIPYKLC